MKRKKSRVFKVLNILLSLILVLELVTAAFWCPGFIKIKKPHKDPEGTVYFQRTTLVREDVEIAAGIMVESYVYARLCTEALADYDLDNGSEEEMDALLEETVAAWELCDKVCDNTEKLATRLEALENESGYTGVYPASQETGRLELTDYLPVIKAYADDTKPLYGTREWAEQLMHDFDQYPAGKGIRGLAAQMGEDVHEAARELQQARDIIYNNSMKEAEKYEKLTQAARVVNTSCKVTLFCAGIVASGGTLTALEGTAFVASGVDTMVDFTTTGASLTLGEDSTLVHVGDEALQYTGMACMVTGGATFRSGNVWDKVSFVGNTLVNDLPDGKVLGGVFDVDADGTVKVCNWALNGDSKDKKENRKVLEEAGMDSKKAEIIAEAAGNTGTTSVIENKPLEEVDKSKVDTLITQYKPVHTEEEIDEFYEESDRHAEEAESNDTMINVTEIPEDIVLEHDVTPENIDGSWEMNMTYRNASSDFAEDITGFLKKMFESVDEVEIGDAKTATFTWKYYVNIRQQSGKKMMIEIFHSEDEAGEAYWAFYEGTFKDGTIDAKLVENRSIDSQYQTIDAGIPDHLVLDFMRAGDNYVLYGDFDIDSYLLSADMYCAGMMTDSEAYYVIGPSD